MRLLRYFTYRASFSSDISGILMLLYDSMMAAKERLQLCSSNSFLCGLPNAFGYLFGDSRKDLGSLGRAWSVGMAIVSGRQGYM